MENNFIIDLKYTEAQHKMFFGNKERFVIITKGRRLGATRGAAQAFIEYALDGITPLLFVDVTQSNISKYYNRYFLPILKKLPTNINWNWNEEKKILQIGHSIIDMKSAERSDSIEG